MGPTCFNSLIAGAGSLTSILAVEVLPVPVSVALTCTELVLMPVLEPSDFTSTVK